MAEVKNAFIKSKMNKDLDDRLIPSGEYRDALNVQVSKSESSDVGALENVIGNSESVDFALIYAQTKTNQNAGSGFTFTLNDVASLKAGMIVRGTGVTEGTKITTITGSTITLDKTATLAAGAVLKIVFDLTCIGYFTDDYNNNIYSFFTDFTDNQTGLAPGYSVQGKNFIFKHNIPTGQTTTLVLGNWLNFSKTTHIIGVNLLEDLLFFTDNRNQPRKINVSLANTVSNNKFPTYYTSEDQVSVAKYNPYDCIKVLTTTNLASATTLSTTLSALSETNVLVLQASDTGVEVGNGVTGAGVKTNTFVVKVDGINITTNKVQNLAIGATVVFAGLQTSMLDVSSETLPDASIGTVVSATTTTANVNITKVVYPGGITAGDLIEGEGIANNPTVSSFTQATGLLIMSSTQTLAAGTKLTFPGSANPYYNANFGGDPDFLEDKFIRFSYRFQFDDGENSIFAPFTQPCFIPKQDGYFIGDDEKQTFSSTVVGFMENKVTEIQLQIPLPANGNVLANIASSPYKIKAIDILYKESDGLAVQVVETIPINDAFGTATGANNVYQFTYESTKPFKTLPSKELIRVYDKIPVKAFSQEIISNRVVYGNFQDKHTPPASLNYQAAVFEKYAKNSPLSNKTIVEYPSSTVKQNRNYQVGIVLSDKFGRQSSTILSNNASSLTSDGFGASTVFSPYQTLLDEAPAAWPGDSLKILFNEVISSLKNSVTGTPGLYNGNAASSDYNPLGWFSYKVVVQQKEQDYYNVYNAGAMKGNPLDVTKDLNTSYISLINDNINKVPRDLSEVGPLQKQFRSSVRLIGRVQNTEYSINTVPLRQGNKQFYPGRLTDTTSSIEDLNSLFDVSSFEDNTASSPLSPAITSNTNAYSPFYKAESDPLIAQITTTSPFGLVNTASGTTPSTYTAIENLTIFETEPDLSRLDFYFETSTSGLISELNTAINVNNDGVFGLSNFNYTQTEGTGLDVDVSGTFQPTNFAGIDIDASSFTGFRVLDGGNNPRTTGWTLVRSGAGTSGDPNVYNLKTNSQDTGTSSPGYQYYGTTVTQQTYTFEFDFRTPAPVTGDPDVDNTFTVQRTLGNVAPAIQATATVETTNNGFVFNVKDTNGAFVGAVGNIVTAPFYATGLEGSPTLVAVTNAGGGGGVVSVELSSQQNLPAGTVLNFGQFQTIIVAGGTAGVISIQTATNGANAGQGFTVTRADLEWEKISGDSFFGIEATNGKVSIQSNSGAGGTYTMGIKVTDAGGLFQVATLTIIIGAPPVPSRFKIPVKNLQDGGMQTYYFTNPNLGGGFSNLDGNNHVISASDYRQSNANPSSIPTSASNVKSGYVCSSPDRFAWNKSYEGDWPDFSNKQAFYVAVRSTVTARGSSQSSASVEFRPDLANANWVPAKDIDGQVAKFGMITRELADGSNDTVQVRTNSSGNLTTAVIGNSQPEFAPQTDYNVQATMFNQGMSAYRIFAFDGGQEFNGTNYTQGEYRITIGNLHGSGGQGVGTTGNVSGYTGSCSGTVQNSSVGQSIQLGDANYADVPPGQSLPSFYIYKVSDNTVAYNNCSQSGGFTVVYAKEWIPKYVTQFYTDQDLTNEKTLPSGRHSFGRIGTGGNEEKTLNGFYKASFNANGLRTTPSLPCTSTSA